MKTVILSLIGLFVFIATGIYWYVSRFDFDREPPVVMPDTLREIRSQALLLDFEIGAWMFGWVFHSLDHPRVI